MKLEMLKLVYAMTVAIRNDDYQTAIDKLEKLNILLDRYRKS